MDRSDMTTAHTTTREVVITGMGTITALGPDLDSSFEAARQGTCAIRTLAPGRLGRWRGDYALGAAATAPDPPMPPLLDERHSAVFSRGTQFALAAAGSALESADLDMEAEPERIGVVTGATAPNSDLICNLMEEATASGSLTGIRSGHAPHCSGHAPAATIGMLFGLRGPMFGVNAACASSNLAVVAAADQIRLGRADVMVAGGFESEIGPVLVASFERAGALSATQEPHRSCRPFDRDRSGVVPGEGAAMFVLESADHARARGATVLATLIGSASTSDAYHLWAPDEARWAESISLAVRDAGLSPADIDYVSAHAAGTPLGDRSESQAIERSLGARAHEIPVSATKGMHGHCFGGSGVELALAVRAMAEGIALPTVGLVHPGEGCNLDYVPAAARPHRGRYLVKNSFGFMGTNCVVVLEVV